MMGWRPMILQDKATEDALRQWVLDALAPAYVESRRKPEPEDLHIMGNSQLLQIAVAHVLYDTPTGEVVAFRMFEITDTEVRELTPPFIIVEPRPEN